EAREKADNLNAADSLVFQTEKQLKEFGDKIPADKKKPIEEALERLKDAHKAQDIAAIDKGMEELNTAFQAASKEMYEAAQQAQQPEGNGSASAEGASGDAEVTDVDFEEVNDDSGKKG
ncbi:MAG: Hsp70 family protein, partial [Flavobacteriales bacterium]|nr:Hsp70 family protein [Flavobacteriales bacterium]MCB0784845.1 Hsp70 family protein [Flavobacteriales bacterium]